MLPTTLCFKASLPVHEIHCASRLFEFQVFSIKVFRSVCVIEKQAVVHFVEQVVLWTPAGGRKLTVRTEAERPI